MNKATKAILERDAYHLRREIERLEIEVQKNYDAYDRSKSQLQCAIDQFEDIKESMKK